MDFGLMDGFKDLMGFNGLGFSFRKPSWLGFNRQPSWLGFSLIIFSPSYFNFFKHPNKRWVISNYLFSFSYLIYKTSKQQEVIIIFLHSPLIVPPTLNSHHPPNFQNTLLIQVVKIKSNLHVYTHNQYCCCDESHVVFTLQPKPHLPTNPISTLRTPSPSLVNLSQLGCLN